MIEVSYFYTEMDQARWNEHINRDGWWQHETSYRVPLRVKLAGTLVALAIRLSPAIHETVPTTRATIPSVQS